MIKGGTTSANRLVSEAWDDAEADSVFTRSENARFALATSLQNWAEEFVFEGVPASLTMDLLNHALGGVAWQELADTWLADAEAEYQRKDG